MAQPGTSGKPVSHESHSGQQAPQMGGMRHTGVARNQGEEEGQSHRENQGVTGLHGQEIDKNGELQIKGQQLIEINGDKQLIQIEGRVRPRDISENNTLPSSRVAEAKISYVGDGILAEKQSPGILSRILTKLGFL